jgi:mono/diheme cytochrome c family protein
MGGHRENTALRRLPLLIVALAGITAWAPAQDAPPAELKLNSGKEIYQAACVACHGPDGKGMPDTTVAFQKPSTFPDFTQCDQTTPELNKDWEATIRDGGAGRGFSRIMPSFGQALTSKQIKAVVEYRNTAGRSPSASNRFHKKLSRSSRGPCTRRYTVWSSRPGSRPSGARPRPGEWQSSTPLRVRDGSNWKGNWRTGFVCRRPST